MTTYVYRDGELVEKHLAEPLPGQPDHREWAFGYSSDTIDPLFHHAAMRYYDSKSAFRKATKDHGCIEVGDQKDYGRKRLFTPKLDKRERADYIRKSIYELRNGRSR